MMPHTAGSYKLGASQYADFGNNQQRANST